MRLGKDDYYLGIAKAVSARSTCIRRRFGAVIVRDDAIVSTGYNGAARGVVNCLEVGCLKDEVGAPEYSGYDFCIGVHAEENAIINAARHGATVKDGALYIFGEYVKDRSFTEARPCERCKRAIINSGIRHVVTKKMDGSVGKYSVENWIKEDTKRYLDRLKKEREKREERD
ncbi:MAG: cytidine/deoxycytidylate deaminase family protein [Promethearchaeota archaeon]